ncbi:MAG: hypothetical protein K2P49_11125, partial [Oscillospiraceae bacterium]|nr:hypothetical protein [Oscillospiraceae bacterium]
EIFSPDKASLTQEYFVYSKENWQSMTEKEPPFGCVDNFQTHPREGLIQQDGPWAQKVGGLGIYSPVDLWYN